MNILLFLKPKKEVVYVYDDYNLKKAMDIMNKSRYTAIPVISRKGEYIGTLTEGDLLWAIRAKYALNIRLAEEEPIYNIPRIRDNMPVLASAQMQDLLDIAINQNFVPVIDDRKMFIGIITRKDIISYCIQKMQ